MKEPKLKRQPPERLWIAQGAGFDNDLSCTWNCQPIFEPNEIYRDIEYVRKDLSEAALAAHSQDLLRVTERADAAEKRVRELESQNYELGMCVRDYLRQYGSTNELSIRVRSALASPLPADTIDTESSVKIMTAAVEGEYKTDALRYQRLRIVGVAPYGTPQLEVGRVLRFTNLDEFADGKTAALAKQQPLTEKQISAGIAMICDDSFGDGRPEVLAQPQQITAEECFAKCSDYSCVRMGACTGEAGRQPQAEHIDESKCLCTHAETGQQLERCVQYPNCPCGGPENYKDPT